MTLLKSITKSMLVQNSQNDELENDHNKPYQSLYLWIVLTFYVHVNLCDCLSTSFTKELSKNAVVDLNNEWWTL